MTSKTVVAKSDGDVAASSLPDEAGSLSPQFEEIDKPYPLDGRVGIVMAGEAFSGPLPHPRHFQRYGEVDVTAPGRILAMAEKEQQFRHHIVEQSLKTDMWSHFTGLVMGWLINLCLIVGAVYLAALGQVAIPAVLMGAAALNVVRTFVDSSWRKKNEVQSSLTKQPVKPPTKPRNRRR
jgi:uncharacterized membrane protein